MLQEMPNAERLNFFNLMSKGCSHFYSKNKIQGDKVGNVLTELEPLRKDDPIFLAKLLCWLQKNSKSKDLIRTIMYLNSISDADGTLFVKNGTLKKPNLRFLTKFYLSNLNPKEFMRLAYMRRFRWGNPLATHFPTSLTKAMRSYLHLMSEKELKSSVDHGFRKNIINSYRLLNTKPSTKAATALKWRQKPSYNSDVIEIVRALSFTGLNDNEIAEKIRSDKIPFKKAVSALAEYGPYTVMALIEQGSPNELVIQHSLFEKSGVLNIDEVKTAYLEKIEQMTVVDRIDRIESIKESSIAGDVKKVRSKARKKSFKIEGHVHLAVDISLTMTESLSLAKEYAAVLADHFENFSWSVFNGRAYGISTVPQTKEEATAALYGYSAGGMTDLLASYKYVQGSANPADYIIYITDEEHTYGSKEVDLPKPKCVLSVRVGRIKNDLQTFMERAGVPFNVLQAEALNNSALVAEAIAVAIKGPSTVIDEIMETKFPVNINGIN